MNLDLDHFKARLLQDALSEAMAAQWIRRAEQFEAAAPRKGDYRGNATSDQLLSAYERCMATARACRLHAQLITECKREPISPEVWAVIAEVAA